MGFLYRLFLEKIGYIRFKHMGTVQWYSQLGRFLATRTGQVTEFSVSQFLHLENGLRITAHLRISLRPKVTTRCDVLGTDRFS